jgi:hypothetical protein
MQEQEQGTGMSTVQELRRKLEGIRWKDFPAHRGRLPLERNVPLTVKGVRFYVKYGLHLQRPALAIIARGNFISFTYVHKDDGRSKVDGHQVILPNTKYKFGGQYLLEGDFEPHRMALIRLDGTSLKLEDLVLRELDT